MTPRILLVEDDPTTTEFMRVALEALPATVACARSQAEALGLAEAFDLCLIDANLPDGRGEDLLQRLRQRQPTLPALAHTADHSPALHAALCAAGFAAVVVKPVTAAALRQAVLGVLEIDIPLPAAAVRACSNDLPVWDDATALNALGGNATHLQTLRGLFLQELDAQATAIHAALSEGDWAAAHQQLHRLRASTGFVGAARLQAAAQVLDASLPDLAGQAEFDDAWQQTRQ
ncbi:Hpt domain-containing protein [Pseudoxanthomonas sp. GM95]|uniref:response regulator n=1 Tax=Pseudoxanthomonas sp. GM95 TaxID=1881043 RepID=UPI0008ADB4C3|nr:response regulator [Pseudoxanthomonas sp. GM95]SEK75526.1 Hpt domain-containing protein [Pseudoxanthomonas sp. GM95]